LEFRFEIKPSGNPGPATKKGRHGNPYQPANPHRKITKPVNTAHGDNPFPEQTGKKIFKKRYFVKKVN
jgi:hypothetical protein